MAIHTAKSMAMATEAMATAPTVADQAMGITAARKNNPEVFCSLPIIWWLCLSWRFLEDGSSLHLRWVYAVRFTPAVGLYFVVYTSWVYAARFTPSVGLRCAV